MFGNADVGNVSDEVHALLERAIATPLTRVEGQTFTANKVLLDGSEWVNCRFVECQIAVVLGAFKIGDGTEFRNCQVAFNGVAGRVLDLSRTRGVIARRVRSPGVD